MRTLIAKTINWIADSTRIRVLPDRLPHPMGANIETLKLPGYCQSQGHTCGFVAGLMILHYFRPGVKAETFYECIRPNKSWGVRRTRLMDCLRLNSLRVSWRTDLDFKGIADAIDANKPIAVVVLTQNETVKHWVVIYGYGRKPDRVFVAGELPFQRHRVYSYGMFKTHFWQYQGFGLICAGPKED